MNFTDEELNALDNALTTQARRHFNESTFSTATKGSDYRQRHTEEWRKLEGLLKRVRRVKDYRRKREGKRTQ